MNLYEENALSLCKMLKEKKVSSKEILKDTFKRIKNTDDKVNSFLLIDEENAMKRAEIIDDKRCKGENLHMMAGIPIAIKDNIVVKGMKNTCGSKMLENYVSPFSATVVKKIENSGGIIVGKLNMDEFAMGSSTETSYFKKTKNPHNLNKVPGGSSGGSASCLSSGQVPLSLGSDTGGSIRQPASYCGVVGLKPTYGTVSRYGLVAFSSSLDQIGPMARTVSDVAFLYSVISGKDKMDATTLDTDFSDFKELLNADTNNLKIGIPKEYFKEGINDEVKEKIENVVKLLEKQGAKIIEISQPMLDYSLSVYYTISCAEASSNLSRFDGVKYGYRTKNAKTVEELLVKSRSEGFGDEVKRRILLGNYVLGSKNNSEYYKKAIHYKDEIKNNFKSNFEDVDIIITPTVPNVAFNLGEKVNDPLEMYLQDVCTVTANIAGIPAISIPCGMNKENMPIGVQLLGNHLSEKLLLSTSYKLERLIGNFNNIAKL